MDQPVMTESGPVIPVLALVLAIENYQPGDLFSVVFDDLDLSPAQMLWQAFMSGVRARGVRPAQLFLSTQHAVDTFYHASTAVGLEVIQQDRSQFLDDVFQQYAEQFPF
jgi:hypothetical protein